MYPRRRYRIQSRYKQNTVQYRCIPNVSSSPLYLKNAIKIYLTTTDKMMADIMTKPTDKTTFLRCCAYILTDGHVD